jgi:hypothetical protein
MDLKDMGQKIKIKADVGLKGSGACRLRLGLPVVLF